MTTAQKAIAAIIGTLVRYVTGLVLLALVVVEFVGEIALVYTGRPAELHTHRPVWLIALCLAIAVACLVPQVADWVWRRAKDYVPKVSLGRKAP